MTDIETAEKEIDWEQEWQNHLYREAWLPLFKGLFSLTVIRVGFLMLTIGTIAGMFINTEGLIEYGISFQRLIIHALANIMALIGAALSFIGFLSCLVAFSVHYGWGRVKENLYAGMHAAHRRHDKNIQKVKFAFPAIFTTTIVFLMFIAAVSFFKDAYFNLIEIRDQL